MIPIITKNDLITSLTQIKSVTPVTATPDSRSSAEFELGRRYQASVEAHLSNGNFRVLVADKVLQMSLPEKFQPGHKLELVLISHEPNPQFLLLDEATLEAQEKNNTISTTGRFLGSLMQDAIKHVPVHTFRPLASSAPIVNHASINSAELPVLLRKAITQSGLFYESHQAQWISGEITLEHLQQEPQNKLLSLMNDTSATKINEASRSPLNTEIPLNSETIPLVMQQLATLETGHLCWQGEIWKNQSIEWDIYEQSDNTKQNEAQSADQWHTRIRLSMPILGDINAKIALNSQGVHISLYASNPDTVNLLKVHESLLAGDMQSAGLNVQSMEVRHDERE